MYWSLKFVQDSETVILDVRGLIYHGDFHFTSRIIGNDTKVWHRDRMTTGSTFENEGDLDSFSTKKSLKESTFGNICKSLNLKNKM